MNMPVVYLAEIYAIVRKHFRHSGTTTAFVDDFSKILKIEESSSSGKACFESR